MKSLIFSTKAIMTVVIIMLKSTINDCTKICGRINHLNALFLSNDTIKIQQKEYLCCRLTDHDQSIKTLIIYCDDYRSLRLLHHTKNNMLLLPLLYNKI